MDDVNALVHFLKTTFLPTNNSNNNSGIVEQSAVVQQFLKEQYIFPIKSCRAVRVKQWYLNAKSGKLKYDRELALVNAKGQTFRLSQYPRMGYIQPSFILNNDDNDDDNSNISILYISAPDCLKRLRIDLTNNDASTDNNTSISISSSSSGAVSICGNQRHCHAKTT